MTLWQVISNRKAEATTAIAVLLIGATLMFRDWFDHHEGTAAWVQAVGAIAVIIATAWIANANFSEERRRTREAERQLWESVAVLSTNCLKCLDEFLRNAKATQVNREGFRQIYIRSDFEAPLEGLASIPLHQIGRVDFISAVIELRRVTGRARAKLDDFQAELERSPVYMEFDLQGLKNLRGEVWNAHASVIRIVHGTTAAVENELSRLASTP